MSKRPYDFPGTRLTTVRLDQSAVDEVDNLRGDKTRSEFIRDALDERLCRFRVNGHRVLVDAVIVGRDKDQRLVVDDGGPLMTDGIDGEIVPVTE